MRRPIVLLALALSACTNTPPPAPPAPRASLTVPLSVGRVWDAVIEQFAETSVPIQTMERASGLIVTTPMGVAASDGLAWANCGKDALGTPLPATLVSYNVLVRGDSTSANLRVTARWASGGMGGSATVECVTRNVYEPDLEAAVAKRAEH